LISNPEAKASRGLDSWIKGEPETLSVMNRAEVSKAE